MPGVFEQLNDQFFARRVGRGTGIWLTAEPVPAINPATKKFDPALMAAWLQTFIRLPGVDESEYGRTTESLSLKELNQTPNPLLNSETQEMFDIDTQMPGDTEATPWMAEMNMNSVQYEVLHNMFLASTLFAFIMDYPAALAHVHFAIGWGFISSVQSTIEEDKPVRVSLEIQPSFGLQYISVCDTIDNLATYWSNYLGVISCPT